MQVSIWFALCLGIVGALSGYLAGIVLARVRAAAAEQDAQAILKRANREAEVITRDAEVHARQVILQAKQEFEVQTDSKRKDMMVLEERINTRESNLERKMMMLDRKEEAIDTRLQAIEQAKAELAARLVEADALKQQRQRAIQEVAAMSQEEARRLLMETLEADLRHEAAGRIRHILHDTHAAAEKEARKIISTAIERYAADQVGEITTCSVPLPNDEMKGRIIGREGRNIRSLEAATGVNILIDDTPEVVVVSGFDPLRREVARRALETLIADGRIHPARIEEVVEKTRAEMDEAVRQAGEEAVYNLKLHGLTPDVLRTVGRLKFRYSYGQNVLRHSVEMGHLMGMMAAELGLDPALARRIGLLHDIGKALDHSIEGSHAIIGADLLKRNGESAVVVNAVAAHHNDVEPESVYAVLAKAADAITAARPGARSETTDIYLHRLEKLEAIANGFRGVSKSYAIQAGREIRVIVEPSEIDDDQAMQLARNISGQIQHDLEYPGQIKVTVIRETRCVEYAR